MCERPESIWSQPLESDLVILEPVAPDHFEEIYPLAADPKIWEQHPVPDRYKREVFKEYFEGAIASGTAFLIRRKDNGAIIGSTRYYDFQPQTKGVAIGYTFLVVAAWGGAWNSAVKKLMIDYAFRYVNKIYFHIGIHNIRSQKAVEKLGAMRLREIGFNHNGVLIPHYEYLLEKPVTL